MLSAPVGTVGMRQTVREHVSVRNDCRTLSEGLSVTVGLSVLSDCRYCRTVGDCRTLSDRLCRTVGPGLNFFSTVVGQREVDERHGLRDFQCARRRGDLHRLDVLNAQIACIRRSEIELREGDAPQDLPTASGAVVLKALMAAARRSWSKVEGGGSCEASVILDGCACRYRSIAMALLQAPLSVSPRNGAVTARRSPGQEPQQ